VLKRSKAAKTLAVRRVTQDNRGKRTAGIDGIKNLKPAERLAMASKLTLEGKAAPVRRIWIPKPGKDEKGALGGSYTHRESLYNRERTIHHPIGKDALWAVLQRLSR
jgi:retron-type reverse transcriptase